MFTCIETDHQHWTRFYSCWSPEND